MPTVEELMQMLESGQLGGGQQQNDDPYIGVPESYTGAPLANDAQATPEGFIGPPTAQQVQQATRAPVFRSSHVERVFSLSPEALARLQRSMVSAGLLDGGFRKGIADDPTISAYKSLLGYANRLGTSDLNQALGILQTTPVMDADGAGEDVYEVPDYATLKQKVKQVFRSQLRRDPKDWELALLADELRGGYDAASQQPTPGGITNDAQATPEGFIGPPTAEQMAEAEMAAAGGGVREAVDPAARFMEAFESRYANELDTLEGEDEAGRTQQVVTSGSGLLARMIGG